MTKAGGVEKGSGLAGFLMLFAALYGAYGALSPFLPAFLAARGLTPQEIATFLATATVTRLVAGPLAGGLADRSGRTRGLLALALGLAAACNLALLGGHAFWPLIAIGVAQAVATAPLAPLADVLALAAARGGRAFEYGWVRAAGSAAFIAATIVSGFLAEVWGNAAGLWLCGAAFGLAALVATRVARASVPAGHPDVSDRSGGFEGRLQGSMREPDPSFETRLRLAPHDEGLGGIAEPGTRTRGFRTLAANTRFQRLVLAAALVIGAHAMHDAFGVIVWREAGISPTIAGLLWSESVAAEILVFLWVGPRLLARIGPPGTMALAALAGSLRWVVQGTTSWLPALVGIQCLHGLTFAALHLACLALIEESVPERLRATALTVYGTFGLGLASALLTLVAGQLFATVGLRAFWAMSVLSLAAVPLALSLRVKN
ncbi:MFS transporter [Methylobacterium haplocladii]|nr:MFS transporter [Methylobacterium haplocladii]GJD83361.1 putative 3-phenylpropionic acid transporter [Methylobacterium haplocladii]